MKKTLLYLIINLLAFNYCFSNDSLKPTFNYPRAVGGFPDKAFLFSIPVSGERPMKYAADNLPKGLLLDEEKGIISGKVSNEGEYKVEISVENKHGICVEEIYIKIGDQLCLTPPMGWNSWNVFTDEINETLLLEIADAMIESGMKDYGYQYINIDDFWHANERAADGKPQVDKEKFPNGMKFIADYLHERGLKLGIYSCAGRLTCGKCFGSDTFEEIDANTYAEWGVDLLKYDYCFAPQWKKTAKERYTKMGNALRNTDRAIVYSICEWGLRQPWQWGKKAKGNYWRITPDIFDYWKGYHIWQKSVHTIVKKAEKVDKHSHVDAWNDLDMLIVGNYGKGKATSHHGKYKGLEDYQYVSHMALWSLFKSPLLSSNNLKEINQKSKEILMNRDLIKINQDELAAPVELISKRNGLRIYKRQLSDGEVVFAFYNYKNKTKQIDLNDFSYLDLKKSKSVLNFIEVEENKLTLKPYQTAIFIQ